MDKQNINLGNWFVDQLNLYQSANSDKDSIKRNFIIRKSEFDLIIGSLKNKKPKDPLQHELILGRRGSGKSTLLKRIQIEIDEKYSKQYIAINLAEEQAGIYRLFDLWIEVINELEYKLGKEIKLEEYSKFKTDQDFTRYLYQIINDLCTKEKKKIILLLDNFDRIVENFSDDGNLLREFLINYNEIQIIAGSTRMDEHFWRYDKPFYEFFRRHRLESLTSEEINQLIIHWSETLEIPQLKDFAENNRGKIENIRILTDGLPRTLQLFIQILLQNSQLYGYDYLRKVMDNVTPLYQERLNYLTPQLRKIISEMAFIWEACTTKQLVEKCRMESKLISANLKTLVDKGIVDKIETAKKNHLYRISERFFNMWLIITQGNPEQKRKAKWLSIFLENWYDANDFKKLTDEHIKNLKDKKSGYNEVLIFSKALSQCKYVTTKERDAIIDLTKELSLKKFQKGIIELPKSFKEITLEITKLYDNEDYTKAITIALEIENEEDGIKFGLLGNLYHISNDFKNSEKYYIKSIAKGNKDSLYGLALLYLTQNKDSQAEEYLILASNLNNLEAINSLALLYEHQGKFDKAEFFYFKAIKSGNSDSLNDIAIFYEKQNRFNDAEKFYIKAIKKNNIDAMFNIALMFETLGGKSNIKKAIKYYLLAIENNHVEACYNLALVFERDLKYEEAIKYYLLAISRGDLDSINNLASIYFNKNEYDEAQKYFLLAIEKGDNNAIFNLALLYDEKKEYDLAEKYYLISYKNGDFECLNNLGIIYSIKKNYSKAKKYYLLAIENGILEAYNNLGMLYQEKEDFKLAEKYLLKSLENNNTSSLSNIALLYHKLGDYVKSEKYYLLAIENGYFDAFNNFALMYINYENEDKAEKYFLEAIKKGIKVSLHNLAFLYDNQGKYIKAEKYYLLAIENGEIDSLNNLAFLYYTHNIKKQKALEAIKKVNELNKDFVFPLSEIIIEIWNGIFINVEDRIINEIKDTDYDNHEKFIFELLVQKQNNLVQKLFQKQEIGKELQDRYTVLYYVTLLLNHSNEDNLELKIPPEISETVQSIIDEIEKRQIFYGYKS